MKICTIKITVINMRKKAIQRRTQRALFFFYKYTHTTPKVIDIIVIFFNQNHLLHIINLLEIFIFALRYLIYIPNTMQIIYAYIYAYKYYLQSYNNFFFLNILIITDILLNGK